MLALRGSSSKSLLAHLTTLLLLLAQVASALKFEMPAHHGHETPSKERCIRNFVARDTLVVVTVKTDGYRGDGQVLNMHIKDAVGNEYGRPRDVVGETRSAFTSHADSAFDVCFENLLGCTFLLLAVSTFPPCHTSSPHTPP